MKTSNNILYDINTQDELGIWNEATNTIENIPSDKEDDDEEDM
jgi:hypothetical protein